MNDELSVLAKTNTGTLIEQRTTKPQEIIQIKQNMQADNLSLNRSIFLGFDDEWSLTVIILEAHNYVSELTDRNSRF